MLYVSKRTEIRRGRDSYFEGRFFGVELYEFVGVIFWM